MAILGILAVVVIPSFINYFRKAKTKETEKTLEKLHEKAKNY